MNVPAASVEVVVPTFNNLHELKACLASLRAQTRRWLKAYVCVDGSNDGTVEYLEALAQSGNPIEVLAHAGNENRGIAATRNLPLERLDAEYVWYVDSDMVLAPDALEAHLALVESMACASQGQVTYGNASQEPWAGYLETRAHHRSPDRAVLPFRWLSGANLLIRTAQVLELGGFDPRFRGYGGEEFDFAYRLEKLSAGPLINNRRAVATTIERKSIARALTQFEEYGATNLHLLGITPSRHATNVRASATRLTGHWGSVVRPKSEPDRGACRRRADRERSNKDSELGFELHGDIRRLAWLSIGGGGRSQYS